MIWELAKNFLSKITKELLSDEIKHIKKVIRYVVIFAVGIFVMVLIHLIVGILILVKCC